VPVGFCAACCLRRSRAVRQFEPGAWSDSPTASRAWFGSRYARSLRTNPPSIRRTLVIVQGVLRCAVEWGRISTNPVRTVRKPSGRRKRVVRPVAPATVECIRAGLLRAGRRRDAALVSVLAYAGLRPGEALALSWDNVGERTLLVEQSNSDAELKATKTEQSRSVGLLAPLATDLAEWRLASGRPEGPTLVFPNSRGEPWTEDTYRNWRRRIYRPAAQAAGIESARPYDLRHSFASLLIHEGASVVEVARQLGHAPSMTLDTYGHVFEEFEGRSRVSAEEAIRAARDELVPVSYPSLRAETAALRKTAANS
jgi:integrase